MPVYCQNQFWLWQCREGKTGVKWYQHLSISCIPKPVTITAEHVVFQKTNGGWKVAIRELPLYLAHLLPNQFMAWPMVRRQASPLSLQLSFHREIQEFPNLFTTYIWTKVCFQEISWGLGKAPIFAYKQKRLSCSWPRSRDVFTSILELHCTSLCSTLLCCSSLQYLQYLLGSATCGVANWHSWAPVKRVALQL